MTIHTGYIRFYIFLTLNYLGDQCKPKNTQNGKPSKVNYDQKVLTYLPNIHIYQYKSKKTPKV